MHLVEVNGRRLLLDCGLAQGPRKESFERNRNLPFDPAALNAVLLSHAHIDHSGNLPSLPRRGFSGKIYCTPATRSLADYMLLDSAHIQESDVAFVNKRRARQGKKLFEPLYTREDAEVVLRHFSSVDYEKTFEPVPGVRAQFLDAGHILGSAIVVLDLEENGRRARLVFTGDLGRSHHPFLRPPQVPTSTDFLILESTYGNRRHEPVEEGDRTFLELVGETFEKSGKLLIPAFALGRTQELVYRLNLAAEAGALPPMDVFVDSPLAVNLTDVFRLHSNCFNTAVLEQMAHEPDNDPLGFPRLHYVRSVEESKSLNAREGPAVIISASGMCESGRILHHLSNHIGKRTTTVLFVGFQAQNTLGRRLLDALSPILIFGEPHRVRARMKQIDSYSAHADREELLAWAGAVQQSGALRRVFLVHGEKASAFALADGLRQQGARNVDVPERGQAFDL
jgi:metallo-beta-lactamase family protein